jgi:hypothetical protein
MLINVMSTEETIDIFISDGRASAIVGDRGIGSPKYVEWRERGLQEQFSIIRVSETIFHAS